MRRKLLNTIGLIMLWTLAVIAAVLAEAMWFAEPAVERGNVAAIEHHLLQRLTDAAAQRKLGCARLARWCKAARSLRCVSCGGRIAAFAVTINGSRATAHTHPPQRADEQQ